MEEPKSYLKQLQNKKETFKYQQKYHWLSLNLLKNYNDQTITDNFIFDNIWLTTKIFGDYGRIMNCVAITETILDDLIITFFTQLFNDWENFAPFNNLRSKVFSQQILKTIILKDKIDILIKFYKEFNIDKKAPELLLPKQELIGIYELRNILAHSEYSINLENKKHYLLHKNTNKEPYNFLDFENLIKKCFEKSIPFLVRLEKYFISLG